jgi:hypothetical protein
VADGGPKLPGPLVFELTLPNERYANISMNVPRSKEHGLFTIWAIPVTHNELCLSKIQNSIFDRSVHYMIVATRAAQQPGLLVRKDSARGGGPGLE